jgi:hypothetical protein
MNTTSGQLFLPRACAVCAIAIYRQCYARSLSLTLCGLSSIRTLIFSTSDQNGSASSRRRYSSNYWAPYCFKGCLHCKFAPPFGECGADFLGAAMGLLWPCHNRACIQILRAIQMLPKITGRRLHSGFRVATAPHKCLYLVHDNRWHVSVILCQCRDGASYRRLSS